MELDLKVDGFEEVRKNVRMLPAALFPEVKAIFKSYALQLQSAMVLATKGEQLKSRSGALSKNWVPEIGGFNLQTLFAQVSNSLPYVAIHQFGGTIEAKRSKYLTIPLKAMKTASGVVKMTIGQAIAARKTFFAKSKAGNLILFENRPKTDGGKNRRPVPLFVLKKSVTIPKRLTFFETAERLALTVVEKLARVISRVK